MSKIRKVTIEYDDRIQIIEGEEAHKFEMNLERVNAIVQSRPHMGMNKINWKIVELHPRKD